MLAYLTRLTSIKNKFKWTEVGQDAFYKIKHIVALDTLLTYPDFDETLKIHTNASAFQLGAVISHKGKPIAFYYRRITDAQKRYTLTFDKLKEKGIKCNIEKSFFGQTEMEYLGFWVTRNCVKPINRRYM